MHRLIRRLRATAPLGRGARRKGAAGALLALLALAAAACAGAGTDEAETEGSVSVLGTWPEGDPQGEAFESLLKDSGIDYDYHGSAAQREVLLSQVNAGTPPDIAVVPTVGDLAEYARNGQLKPIGGQYEPSQYKAPWQPRARGKGENGETVRPHRYWVPVNANLKSIVWHRDKNGSPVTPPSDAGSWCIGMNDDGPSGWPGSDWIEDIVLQRHGKGMYTRMAGGTADWTSKEMADVWRGWGALLAQDHGAKGASGNSGDSDDSADSADSVAARALLTDYRDEHGQNGLLFGSGSKGAHPACSLEHQGSFARSYYGDWADDARFAPSHKLLPGGPYTEQGREVTGDFAVLFSDSAPARELLAHLASPEMQGLWARNISDYVYTFSANSRVEPRTHEDRTSRRIAARLADKDSVRCLDASDAMPPAVRDAFYEAVLRFLSRPGEDPRPWLQDVQDVQEAERRDLGLDEDEPWMTGICSRP